MSDQPEYNKVRASALGAELHEDEAKILAQVMGIRQLRDGELLSAEGGAAHTLYVLAEGKLSVLSNIDGVDQPVPTIRAEAGVVYTMTAGECAGTRAFVDRAPRKASLRALGQATVFTLEPDAFESLLGQHPRVVYKVMRALFRITHTNLMRMNQETQQLSNYINKTHGRY